MLRLVKLARVGEFWRQRMDRPNQRLHDKGDGCIVDQCDDWVEDDLDLRIGDAHGESPERLRHRSRGEGTGRSVNLLEKKR
jgi:hypothetical protein